MRSSQTDAQIQQGVLRELEAEPHVECTEVGVRVHDQIVTLTGTVTSWAKKLAASDAAHRVAGVKDVANDLVVQRSAPTEESDTALAAAIRHALVWDVFVPEDRIETTVSHGVVTLQGEVEYAAQRDDAARAIGNLDGVCAIDNLLVVTHTSASPASIRASIRAALERHASREAGRIELEVERGHVVLRGEVRSQPEHDLVIAAARGSHGVEVVVDHLVVRRTPTAA